MSSRKDSASTKGKKQLDPLTTATIQQVLCELKVQPDDWDAVIIGDGSGEGRETSCGWASVLIDHYGGYRVEFYGGRNKGTSYQAEIQPYLDALTWYVSGPGKAQRKPTRVHLITDNATVANCGNRVTDRSTYAWLWASFTHIERMDYILKWHWIKRDRLALNRLCDYVSGMGRLEMARLRSRIESDLNSTVEELLYDYNPSDTNHGYIPRPTTDDQDNPTDPPEAG
jgi:ribonuclease HI